MPMSPRLGLVKSCKAWDLPYLILNTFFLDLIYGVFHNLKKKSLALSSRPGSYFLPILAMTLNWQTEWST